MFRLVAPSGTPIKVSYIYKGIEQVWWNDVIFRFQEELKQYFHVKYCFLVSSGRAALTLILQTLRELSPYKTEVIIPGYTCYSVPSAVVKAGLKIVLADISFAHLGIDTKRVSALINKNTLAIIPVHLLGIPCDIDELNKIASAHDVWLIDNAAQAMDAKWNGKMVGTFGQIGFFSLGRGKNMTTGDGGIIVTDSEEIALRVQKRIGMLPKEQRWGNIIPFFKILFLACFLPPHLYWFVSKIPFLELGKSEFSIHFKLAHYSKFAAGIGILLLDELSKNNTIRRMNATVLFNTLKKLKTDFIRTVEPSREAEPVYLRFPLFFSNDTHRQKMYTRLVQELVLRQCILLR